MVVKILKMAIIALLSIGAFLLSLVIIMFTVDIFKTHDLLSSLAFTALELFIAADVLMLLYIWRVPYDE